MMNILRFTLLVLPLCAAACTGRGPTALVPQPAQQERDREELLRLHEEQRSAHLQKRAELLVRSQADTMISVSRGRVSFSRRDAAQARFQEYFDSVEFRAWDDAAAPIIQLSGDGTMAYVVVQKRVHVVVPASAGAARESRTEYAWVSIYEKRDGRWRLTVIASTDRPEP
jgi:hypothetical protein